MGGRFLWHRAVIWQPSFRNIRRANSGLVPRTPVARVPCPERTRMASHGYLALVLHAHLPYVRHPEYDEFLEEDWLYEAIVETYLPMLQVLWRMADEGVRLD